jgi:hypothetical protein
LIPEQQEAVGFLEEFTKRMVLMGFEGGKTMVSVTELMKEIYRACDDLLGGYLLKERGLACQRGCHWCCYLRVTTTPLEVLYIMDHLRSKFDPDAMSALQERVRAMDTVTRGLDGEGRAALMQLCPLADEGECLVYPVRPVACRFYHSLDASDCQETLVDQCREVRVRKDLVGMGVAVSAGLRVGLSQVGLKNPALELITGLRVTMGGKGDGLAERWLGGESLFV